MIALASGLTTRYPLQQLRGQRKGAYLLPLKEPDKSISSRNSMIAQPDVLPIFLIILQNCRKSWMPPGAFNSDGSQVTAPTVDGLPVPLEPRGEITVDHLA